jgi:hypothetical protein
VKNLIETRISVIPTTPYNGPVHVLHFEQMSNTITVRLPQDLAEWLETEARKTGVPKGRIVREELEKARKSAKRPFLRWAGAISGPSGLSTRKGFSRK